MWIKCPDNTWLNVDRILWWEWYDTLPALHVWYTQDTHENIQRIRWADEDAQRVFQALLKATSATTIDA